jgi:hypothetical protein
MMNQVKERRLRDRFHEDLRELLDDVIEYTAKVEDANTGI